VNIDRNFILRKITETLQPTNYVNALWLEGADSLGTVDQYSDIDLWVDVNDGNEQQAIATIKNCLKEMAELDFEHEAEHPHPKIRQLFFHIKGTSKFIIIDLCIQSNSRVFWFTEDKEGEKVRILFDKKNVIAFKPMDKIEMGKELTKRKEYLLGEFQIKKVDTEKEIERDDYLGALNFYISLAEVFTELVRIKYNPNKHEFGLKHANRDLSVKARLTVEKIYQFRSIRDLRQHIILMDETIGDLK